jgi:hypothetical protein
MTRWKIVVGIALLIIAGMLGLLWAGVSHGVDFASYLHATAVKDFWQVSKDFLNSVFFTSIAGALGGAFFGAYGGQRIVERGKVRDQLLVEIRNTNAAIMVAFSICNALLSMKGQHLKRLKETYDEHRREVIRRYEMLKSGAEQPDKIFRFTADFETLFLSPLPLDVLQTQIFEKLSPTGQVILLTTTLRQTIHNLDSSIHLRNSLIEEFKSRSPLPQNELIAHYFGLAYADGHVDQRYPTALEAVSEQADGGIFFSKEICVQLVKHGASIVQRFEARFGKNAPAIAKPDFAKAVANDLMPPDTKYADWMAMFT